MHDTDSSARLGKGDTFPTDSAIFCWIVTGGAAGMEKQALALAERLGYTAEARRVKLRTPWRQATPPLLAGLRWATSPRGDAVRPPFPPVLIACGRAAIAPALAARGCEDPAGGRRPFVIFIGDPRIDPARFDLVVAPAHDQLEGPNVVPSLGSLHAITADRLAAAEARFAGLLAGLPPRRVAVLIGGPSRHYRFGPAEAAALGGQLAELARREGLGLMLTASRRSGSEVIAALRQPLEGVPHVFWDGGGENPYEGFLAHATAVIVTADSVNMASEAVATGAPVFIAGLPGRPSRIARFHAQLYEGARARPFEGRLDLWQPPNGDTMAETVEAVAARLAAAGLPEPAQGRAAAARD